MTNEIENLLLKICKFDEFETMQEAIKLIRKQDALLAEAASLLEQCDFINEVLEKEVKQFLEKFEKELQNDRA